ncbi:MAG: acyl-CoA dehydrogenase [Gammaproteobacteria bacterium]
MSTLFWIAITLGGALALGYNRATLKTVTIAAAALYFAYWVLGDGGFLWSLVLLLPVAALVALNMDDWRKENLSKPALAMMRKALPEMSSTERVALDAGTVGWDGDLFSGNPDWNKLLGAPKPTLSVEEQAFLDGPVEEACAMIDEWQITHELADLPEELWTFLKENKFFAMIIPKAYNGLEFSALGHSAVIAKLSSRSTVVSSTVAVPNSLGPGELLMHYGTEEQKNHYLPRLAVGKEIPCFGLTSPRAGSDATSISDTGIVCKGMFEGEEVLGLRLNWDKRYITLAPVATVIGLAFRMYDPDQLIGDVEDLGITCALIPATLPGVTSGRRHFPLNVPFQNGPTQGENVFIPLSYIIGGQEMAGEGWRMLVECLTVGRSISLPSTAVGGGKAALAVTGAYARIRRQFNLPVGKFEGVQELIARIAGLTYAMDGAVKYTCGEIDRGQKPGVPSAILKYHCTEFARKIANDAMDIHGGKGICLGPNNYLGRGYQAVPISITVEGANVMTRSLIIFGQGAIRCHPYMLNLIEACNDETPNALDNFDKNLFGMVGNSFANAARSCVLALTSSRLTPVPVDGPTKHYYQQINRYSSAYALAADVAMMSLQGSLKKREMLSGRLGDILSCLYFASCVLKKFEDEGRRSEDLPVVDWAIRHFMYTAQEQLHGVIRNLPNRALALALRIMVFPRGRMYSAPSDALDREVSELMIRDSQTRDKLVAGTFLTPHENNIPGRIDQLMREVEQYETLEKKLRTAVKEDVIPGGAPPAIVDAALAANVFTAAEAEAYLAFDAEIQHLSAVDDFSTEELMAGTGADRQDVRRDTAA